MAKFPADAPKRRVIKTLQRLGFRLAREHEHISITHDSSVQLSGRFALKLAYLEMIFFRHMSKCKMCGLRNCGRKSMASSVY
jgi:hypothetical protein